MSYNDQCIPVGDGHSIDVASQRQDQLDISSLGFLAKQLSKKSKVIALDLGGGRGAHSINMAKMGAQVLMVDLMDHATTFFQKEYVSDKIIFLQKDIRDLTENDIPSHYDMLYSQRAIHYIPFLDAQKILRFLYLKMNKGGGIFISAAGLYAEYGATYFDREKPIAQRFNFVAPDMQKKLNILHKLVLYTEQDMMMLLQGVGFSKIEVYASAFGTIKASARKI